MMRQRISAGTMLLALLLVGFVVAFAGCGGDSETVTTTETTSTDTTTTTDTDSSFDPGQGVDETCDDLVAFIVLANEKDIGRGGDSVDDVEEVAAAASELADNAPADSAGEPRDSFVAIAAAYETYLSVLSEGDLEPGPDALLEPRVAEAYEDLGLQFGLGVAPWADEHCSQETLDQLADVVNG